ncbi:hypothetical protein BDR07DRAFT_1374179 [Suillus spraguei]|nr:hypothetical protein BDR07DRAFT_1374179 [Suillus spraguei]
MSEDHRTNPPPETSGSPPTPGESLNQPRGKFRQALQKCKNVIKKVSKTFKRSRHQTPAVQNADHEGASSFQNVQDVSRLHPSDDHKPVTSENSSGRKNQGGSAEPASKVIGAPPGVEEIHDPQLLAEAKLHDAREGMESVRLLGKHATEVASAVKDGLEDLDAADNFQTTYFRPLRIFDTVVGNLGNVWGILLSSKRADQVV